MNFILAWCLSLNFVSAYADKPAPYMSFVDADGEGGQLTLVKSAAPSSRVKKDPNASKIVKIRALLHSYNDKNVIVKTPSGKKLTFPREYAPDFDGTRKSKIEIRLPASKLIEQLRN